MISQPTLQDYNELTLLWEASVRSTHHFLTEENIRYYKPLVREQYLPAVDLYIIRREDNRIVAFMGLSDELIEMLFVHPDAQGKGYGKQLIDFAVNKKQITKVDVNEQNEKALQFYLNRGFDVIGRDATDPSGKPFPILHMEITAPFVNQLSKRFHIEDIHSLIYQMKYNSSRKEELYQLIFDKDNYISYQALWTCSHLPLSERKWLESKQEELIEEVLHCPHSGKRRILLQLLEKQSFKDTTRVDFLDFCLNHMLSKQEPPGIQSLCIKLAYKLCQPIPELLQEFWMMIEIAKEEQGSAAVKSAIRNLSKKKKQKE